VAIPHVKEEWRSRFLGPGDLSATLTGTWKMLMFCASSLNVELLLLSQEEHLLGKEVGRVKDGTRCLHTGILQPRSVHFLLQSELPPGWRQRCRTLIPCIARWPIPERSQNHRWRPKCHHVSLQHDRSKECPLRLVWVPCGLKNNILRERT